jgi:hypothetical protein
VQYKLPISVSDMCSTFLPVLKAPIQVEYFSYNKMINEKFMNVPETMSTLEGIMNEIFMRRADRIPQIPYVFSSH